MYADPQITTTIAAVLLTAGSSFVLWRTALGPMFSSLGAWRRHRRASSIVKTTKQKVTKDSRDTGRINDRYDVSKHRQADPDDYPGRMREAAMNNEWPELTRLIKQCFKWNRNDHETIRSLQVGEYMVVAGTNVLTFDRTTRVPYGIYAKRHEPCGMFWVVARDHDGQVLISQASEGEPHSWGNLTEHQRHQHDWLKSDYTAWGTRRGGPPY